MNKLKTEFDEKRELTELQHKLKMQELEYARDTAKLIHDWGMLLQNKRNEDISNQRSERRPWNRNKSGYQP